MHVEEGNTDFLNEQGGAIINFSKRRFITEIISEIQRFQDQPYCLTTEPKIKVRLLFDAADIVARAHALTRILCAGIP